MFHERKNAAEETALEAMVDLAAACDELRAAIAADSKVSTSKVAKLDVQRRFAWSRVNDALSYAEASLRWDNPSRDLLLVHSEATQKLYGQYHSHGVALAAGPEVVGDRNKLMRAAGAAERALEELGIVYDQSIWFPQIYPGEDDPSIACANSTRKCPGRWTQRSGASQPRNRSLG